MATRFKRPMGVVVPTKIEEASMSVWLREMHIAFEVTRHDYDNCIELKFVDYKNSCLLVSKKYEMRTIRIGHKALQRLVKKFEKEEIYPLLFGEPKSASTGFTPKIRLIREN